MAQAVCRLIHSNMEVEPLTNVLGSTILAIGDHIQMKTENVKISINGSIFAPFDYNETTKIDTTYNYKFDKKCVFTIFNAVAVV